MSFATNLVEGDTNGFGDVFISDPTGGAIRRISVATDGTQANSTSWEPTISADGSTIVYLSLADNLVANDSNETWDVFAYDMATRTTQIVSVATDGTLANGTSESPAVSGDGSIVVYTSDATNLVDGDTNEDLDVFMRDLRTKATTLVSVNINGIHAKGWSRDPAVSADGSTIAYYSDASNLVPMDTNSSGDIFTHEVATGNTRRVSVASGGAQVDFDSWDPSLSADGSVISYTSFATNLVEGDTNGDWDIFVHDVATLVTRRVSVSSDGAQSTAFSDEASISHDGTKVVFRSYGGLIRGDLAPGSQIYLHDLAEHTTSRVSVAPDGSYGNNRSGRPSMSADGSVIVFHSVAGNLVSGDTSLQPRFPGGHVFLTRGINPFDDDDGSIYEPDIEWEFVVGITAGCGVRLFCPSAVVTRGQMAAYLSRALALPATDGDYFTDDDGSIFEGDINRLAQSGITRGCAETSYCPDAPVTREQMAAFLVRAAKLTDDGGGNLFSDDDTSIFEKDIDKLASAGAAAACNPPTNTNFCPTRQVTRDQMAAIMRRTLQR